MRTTRVIALLCAAVLGAGSAAALAACGEDRGVEVEGGTTGSTGGSTVGTTGTGTTP
jgi:hypothetical protein